MHPNTKPTTVVLILCMVILGILLLPLPFTAYKVLKFILSLCLLCAAAFFLRPCKKLSFTPVEGLGEYGTYNPTDGTFSGTLKDARTGAQVAVLDEENSQIIAFLGDGCFTGARSLPPISLQISLGLAVTAVILNPFTPIHLPRASWLFLDVVVIALLGWALHVIRAENAGNRPYVSLTGTVGQPPTFPFMRVLDVFPHALRLWPAVLGVIFVIALFGTQIAGGKLEDMSLENLAYQTTMAFISPFVPAWVICWFTGGISNTGVTARAERDQVPGEFFITIFLLILLSFAFGGFFTPNPSYDPDDTPDGYVPYDRSDDY
jgi:hypothetical protein